MRADSTPFARRYHGTHSRLAAEVGNTPTDRALDAVAAYRAAKRIVAEAVKHGIPAEALRSAIEQHEASK